MTDWHVGGVVAPVTTPFDGKTGDVDPGALGRQVTRLLAAGVDGVVVAGSTGESALLAVDELRLLVVAAREAVPASHRFLVGSGAESTRAAVALTRLAAQEGADAVLVRAPAYFARDVSPAGLRDYYRAVAEASRIPILAYNIPRYTGLALAPELLAELAQSGHIVGVKDSSGDRSILAEYRRVLPGRAVLVGSAALLLEALGLGCEGGILAVACFAPTLCRAVWEAFQRGDVAAATAWQDRLAPLQTIVSRHGPPGVKAAMDLAGLEGGPCRAPLGPLSLAERHHIHELLFDG